MVPGAPPSRDVRRIELGAAHWLLPQFPIGMRLGVGTHFCLERPLRGAHFASHDLWSAALCWGVALLWLPLLRWRPA